MKRASKPFRIGLFLRNQYERSRLWLRTHDSSATTDHLIVRKLTATRRPNLRQLSLLFSVLNDQERRIFITFTLIALVSGVVITRQLWYKAFVRIPTAGGVYTEAIVGAPEYVNPLYAISNDADRDLVRLLFAGLVRFDAHGEMEPDLAESVVVAPQGNTYTITLKPGMTWSDGEPVTSDDVRFTIDAIKNPAYRSPLKSNFNSVHAETLDERTVRITLATTSAPFMENLTIGILPSHLWAAIDPKNALLTELNRKPVSVGPYQFESFAKDPSGQIRSYTMVRRTQGTPRVPLIERVVFKFYPDSDEALNALKNRNSDGLVHLPADVAPAVLKIRKDLVRHRMQIPQYTAIFFNPKENAILENVRIRTALGYAISRHTLIKEVLQGEGSLIEGPFFPNALGFDPYASSTPFDLNATKDIFDQEGWKLPEGEVFRVHEKTKQKLSITLTTVGQPEQFHTAELIQRQWQDAGVKVDIQVIEPSNIFDLIRPRAYAALLVSEITGIDPDPYPFWHSSGLGEQGLNLANFSARDADILLEDARKTMDRAIREKKYHAFQKILAREMPAIFLFTPLHSYAVNKKINGITLEGLANSSDRFVHIERWYIDTDWRMK